MPSTILATLPIAKPELQEQAEDTFNGFKPSDKERTIISEVFPLFKSAQDNRNRSFENFDGSTLIEYIEDSYRRYNTNVDMRDDMEDWQSSIHDPFTRNKVNAILGKVVSVLPIAEVQPRGDEDDRKALIVSNLYEYSEDVDDYEEFLITMLNEAIVKGTAIGYEGHELKETKIRNIKGSGDDIKVTNDIRKENKLTATVVKLEDFYPSSVGFRRIKDMPRCWWRNKMNFQQFMMDFSMYDKSKYVQPHRTLYGEDEDVPYYFDYISSDVMDGEVEVIRYYDKENDQFIILANGIWLNPIMIKDTEEVSPLPFNHKELPFFDIKFELFSSDFFYGKSLPDKLKNLQDVLNVLTNMLLDQSFLTVFKPILTNGFDSVEDDYLRPGRRTPVDTQGLPIRDAFMPLDMGTPSGWHQYILEYTRKVMEEASLDKVSSGQAGAGDRTTAREINVAAEGVSSMLGLFGRWVKYGIKRKAMLRCKNILQFWTDENSPILSKVLGETGASDVKEAFNTFKMGQAVLSNGKRGTKVIEMYKNKDAMPTKTELEQKSNLAKLTTDKQVEYVALDASNVRDLDFDIKLVPSPRSEVNKDMEKALQLEKVRIYLSFFPDLVDREELLAQTAEKMGDDPQKIISPKVLNPQPQQDNQMLDKGAQTQPQGNTANNAVQGMMGGKNDMAALANEMQG